MRACWVERTCQKPSNATYSSCPGGFWLANTPQEASSAPSLALLAAALRFDAPHLLSPASTSDPNAVAAFAAAGLPLAPLTGAAGSPGLTALLQSYAASWGVANAGAPTSPSSRWALVDACAPGSIETAASLTFRATAALSYGATGLLWTGVSRCAADPVASAPLLAALANLAQQLSSPASWGSLLLDGSVVELFATDPTTVPGASAPGIGHTIVELGTDLIATVIKRGSVDAPPLILLVDASCVGASGCTTTATRRATATLAPTVFGWGVVEGDTSKGFPSCGKTVVGAAVDVELTAGGAELLLLIQLLS